MAVSANSPNLNNPIRTDVPAIQQKEAALLKMDPTNVSDLEVGAKRLTEISSGNWQFQTWNGSQWANAGKLKMDVDTVDGYDASITPKANTVAVRGSDGKLQDSITGNAATADSAVTLSETLVVGKGGTGATTSEQARSNLGVPPTSHASANTTYGISSETVYGHAKASSDAPAQDTDAGAVGTKTSEFARGDHAHKKVLGTSSVYGQVKLTDSVSDGSAASSSVAASGKAVKTAYDKAVNAYDEANKAATTIMTGATESAAGQAGLVPAPAQGKQDKPLNGAGQWADFLDCVVTAIKDPDGNIDATKLKQLLSKYLPLTGGNLTGPLIFSNLAFISEELGDIHAINFGTSLGGTSGPILTLRLPDAKDAPGAFYLGARMPGVAKYLMGATDGSLYWDGGRVIVSNGLSYYFGAAGGFSTPEYGSWLVYYTVKTESGNFGSSGCFVAAGGTYIPTSVGNTAAIMIRIS